MHQFYGNPILRVRMNLNAHLRDPLVRSRILSQLPSLVNVRRQRLLAVNIQPAPQRRHRLRGMHVVRRADAYRVQILVIRRQHLPPVLVQRGFRVSLLDPTRTPGIDLGHADQFDVRVGGDPVKGGPGHSVSAH